VQNRNKKSVTADLRLQEGREIVRRIAKDADVVIENFRPGTLEKWGLGYDALAADNPGLVMLRLSGFGQSGPYRDQTGFGAIAESMGGLRYVTGFPDRPPVRPNLSIGDALASLHGVIGALMALRHRDAHGARSAGRGQVVDVALYEAVFNMMEGALPEYDLFGENRERTGSNLTGIVPSNTYLTRDGQHIVIGANADSIFKRLMQMIGRTDLAEDPSLADNAGRAKRAGDLDAAIGAWTAGRSAEAALAALAEAQVPSGKIYSMADIAADAQYLARDMIRQVALADGTPLKVPGVVPRLSDTPGDIGWVGPALGEHTETVLAAHGYGREEIAALRARKAV
jgi:formyl-CoA transferase